MYFEERQKRAQPDQPFHNFGTLNSEFHIVQERRAADFEAPKFWEGFLGKERPAKLPKSYTFTNI